MSIPAPGPALKILMTEGSSLSARQTLYSLGANHTIDILDPAPLCQGRFSRFVRRWHRCPNHAKQPQEFLQFLVDLIGRESYDVLLPTHEQVYLLSKYRDAFSGQIGLALPNFPAMQKLQDKAQFTRLLQQLELPYPETDFIRTDVELMAACHFPYYVKLAFSTAGCGVHYVTNAKELEQVVEKMNVEGLLDGHCETLVQQPARGCQSTVQAVFNHGRLIAAHCFEARAVGVGGMSTARVSASHPIVLEHVAQIGSAVDWHGSLFIDYFYDDESGQPQYIEANPRIGETVNSSLCGVNLCERLVRLSVGEPLDRFEKADPAIQPCLTHSFMMILISMALNGAGRWALVREWGRNLLSRGLYRDSQDELTRPRQDYLSVVPLIWIGLQLLVLPRRSESIVAKTVDDYALPESAVERVHQLPDDLVDELFSQLRKT
ncbi:MAG: hypothetical protein AAGG48_23230 [Planctomycetota bacterium]